MNVNLLAFLKTLELAFYIALASFSGWFLVNTLGVENAVLLFMVTVAVTFVYIAFQVYRSQIIHDRKQKELDKKHQ